MSTQIHVLPEDKTPQIRYYRAAVSRHAARAEVEPAREPCYVPLAVKPWSAWWQRGGYSSLLT